MFVRLNYPILIRSEDCQFQYSVSPLRVYFCGKNYCNLMGMDLKERFREGQVCTKISGEVSYMLSKTFENLDSDKVENFGLIKSRFWISLLV